ncbi:MAG TPA: NAD(P) transhydrogenase subunit alpha [Atribacter sp.]|jgi:NAD(P) transhydrogenase subunit alpha|uniref:NAD(P) transhydrogenase subunit alpha n=1 Tax=Atribacter sp. TaxID=2847780 RepID=UPI0017706AD4|nr:NAD(P) transhydrogenase subunit alpha [Atribacter sp.]MDI9594240.1 NAD(P) transhydrogenase subunit alpha [Atribacterota bacterium]HHT10215.1 NAD(P) transhydrogenase subunit alpha [Candidatus Atribacteria bacterium]HQK83976.1 NAD(P) transhydrogenase subunit alpha [Atribacter sp.]
MKYKDLIIGIPREIMNGESRVAAIPETVKKLVNDGARVLIETNAGLKSYFSNELYENVGAEITINVEDIYETSDLILKVKEPLFNKLLNKSEVEMMKKGQYLITFLHPASPSNHKMVSELAEKGVNSLTLDGMPRITRAQTMDALTSMSTVAGYKSVLMAANRLRKFMPMVGTAVGMIKPANVLVIGTGVAGLQAIATARRLGAVVSAIDIRSDAQEQAKSLGAKIIDVGVPKEIAVGDGFYACSLPENWLSHERDIIREKISQFDIIILSALVPGKQAPVLITDDMVKMMNPGSVIVDIAIDQGGNCEATVSGEVVEKYLVSIDGTKNIPGQVPESSTWMFAHNIFNFLSYLVKDGQIVLDWEDEVISSTIVTFEGKILHKGTREAMDLV